MGESDEKLIKAIKHYQDSLERHTKTGISEKLLHAIEKLAKLPIRVCHLEETGVGRTVNCLKKNDGQVGDNARALVDKWKSMVKGEEDDQQRVEQEQLEKPVETEPVEDEPDPESLQIVYPEESYEKPRSLESSSSSLRKSSSSTKNSHSSTHSNRDKRSRSRDRQDKKSKGHDSSNNSDNSDSDSDHDVKKHKSDKNDKHSKNSSHRRHSDKESDSSSKSDDSDNSDSSDSSDQSSSDDEESNSDRDSSRDRHSRKHNEKGHNNSDSKHKTRNSSSSEESEDDMKSNDQYSNKSKDKHSKHKKSSSESDKDKKDKHNSKSKETHRESKELSSKSREKSKDSSSKFKDSGKSKDKHDKRDKENESSSSKKDASSSSKSRSKRDESESKHKKVDSYEKEKSKTRDSEKDSKKSRKSEEKKKEESRKESSKSHKERENGKTSHDKKRSRESSMERDTKRHKSESSENKESKLKSSGSSKSREKEASEKKKDSHSKTEKDKKDRSETDKNKKSTSDATSSKSKEKDKPKPASSSKNKSSKKLLEGEVDSGSGTSFADVLGMLQAPPVYSKSKKKSIGVEDKHQQDRNSSGSTKEDRRSKSRSSGEGSTSFTDNDEVPNLLKDPGRLEPLDINISSLLPSITPNYRPLGTSMDSQNKKMWSDDEALTRVITAKHQRTKVYSGNKATYTTVPTLFEICGRILQDNLDALEYTGGVPYSILKHILEKANPDQLYQLEFHNPYLIEDTDELWQLHCQKEFRNKKREELESWREMYMRCLDEREARLKALTANIKMSQDKSIPIRQTKLAYVDSVVKPPRGIARRQAKNGTAVDIKRPSQTPAERLIQLARSGEAAKVAVPNPGKASAERSSSSSSHSSHLKPKKAPLMAKTLSLLKNRFGRR